MKSGLNTYIFGLICKACESERVALRKFALNYLRKWTQPRQAGRQLCTIFCVHCSGEANRDKLADNIEKLTAEKEELEAALKKATDIREF